MQTVRESLIILGIMGLFQHCGYAMASDDAKGQEQRAEISDTIRTDSRMIGTIDSGIRVDPRISNGNDGIRIFIEPQNYMLHRESFRKDLAPDKMAAAAVSAGEGFVTRERPREASVCYEDAIQCIRNDKIGIDDGLKKRIVTGYCDLHMSHRDAYLTKLEPEKMAVCAVEAAKIFDNWGQPNEASICYDHAVKCFQRSIAVDSDYARKYDTLKKRYNDQEVSSFFDVALSDVPAFFKKAWSQHPHLIATHTPVWAQEFGSSLELAANGDWTEAKMHLTRANIPEIDDRGPWRTTQQVPKADYMITACLLDKMLGNESKSAEELQSVYDLHQSGTDFNNLDSCSLFWHFKRNQRE